MPKRVVTSESYFTPIEVAKLCLSVVDESFPVETFDHIIEPCVGDGAFFNLLPMKTRLGIDLEPQVEGVVQCDFLQWMPKGDLGRVLTIGNPPFGQRAALAVRFLECACRISDVVAFILPQSFNKYTFQNRVDLRFHLCRSINLNAKFRIGDDLHEVKTVFQVWQKRPDTRQRVKPVGNHPDFSMKHAHLSRVSQPQLDRLKADHDFAIAQVGSNFRPRETADLSQGSYWFIKAHVPGVREVFEQLDFQFLDAMNVAHKSLGKPDIVAAYRVAIGEIETANWGGITPEEMDASAL